MDLVTVVTHELGHLLGLNGLEAGVDPNSIMTEGLDIGIRRLPDSDDLLVVASAPVSAALEADGVIVPDSIGTDFWLTFPASLGLVGPQAELSLRISSRTATTGRVEIPGLGFARSFSVVPGVITQVTLPISADLGFTSDAVTNKGIHVMSNAEVTVYGVSRAPETTDAFLGLPTEILGTNYVVLGYKNLDLTVDVTETFPGTEFAIVAT